MEGGRDLLLFCYFTIQTGRSLQCLGHIEYFAKANENRKRGYGLSYSFPKHISFSLNYGTGIIHARSIAINIFRSVEQ